MQLPADAAVALPATAQEWAALNDGDHGALLQAWTDDVLVDVTDAHVRQALTTLAFRRRWRLLVAHVSARA